MKTETFKGLHGTATLYLGDCLDILPTLTGVDAVITDPPYGMNYDSGWSSRPIIGDESVDIRDKALKILSGIPSMVFGRWDCPRPLETRARLIWSKGEWPGMGDLAFPFGPSDEEIYIIGSGFNGPRIGTVISHNRITGGGLHPNEKPVALIAKLLSYCPSGTVADPFCGSGTTGIACLRTGRNFIGIEKDPKHFATACERFAREIDGQLL